MQDYTGIIKAVKTGKADRVCELLDADAGLIGALDSDGSTPLHCAAWKGLPGIVRLLLERGADVAAQNQNTHWGGTPLHAAAHANQRAVAEMLLDAGADPNAVSLNGRTPLQETTVHNATAVARLLRERGASD